MTTTVLRRALGAALLFASKETFRPHLECVRLDIGPETKRMLVVGVDGHRLTVVSIPAEHDGESMPDVSIPRRDAERLFATLKREKRADKVRIVVAESRVLVGDEFHTGSLGTFSASEEFVPYRQVVPKRNPGTVSSRIVGVNPTYVADACRVFALVYGKNAGMIVEPFTDPLHPMHFYSPRNAEIRTTVVVMPMRVDWAADPDMAA